MGKLPAEDDAGIIKTTGVVEPIIDTEEAPQIPILQSDEDVVEVNNEPSWQLKAFKLPMWLLGPQVGLFIWESRDYGSDEQHFGHEKADPNFLQILESGWRLLP